MKQSISLPCAREKVDWGLVRTTPVKLVMLEVGKGFSGHYEDCTAYRFPVGAYWTCHAASVPQARREVRSCLAWLQGRRLDAPLYIRCTGAAFGAYAPELFSGIAAEFCEKAERSGYRAGISAPRFLLETKLLPEVLSTRSIWLIETLVQEPGYAGIWTMWEDTHTAEVAGMAGLQDRQWVREHE